MVVLRASLDLARVGLPENVRMAAARRLQHPAGALVADSRVQIGGSHDVACGEHADELNAHDRRW